MMKKFARIVIPEEKMEAVSNAWSAWVPGANHGQWKAQVHQTDIDWFRNEQTFIIEGDPETVNPIINTIVDIVKS